MKIVIKLAHIRYITNSLKNLNKFSINLGNIKYVSNNILIIFNLGF